MIADPLHSLPTFYNNSVFTKTKDYVSTFSRFEGAEMAAAART